MLPRSYTMNPSDSVEDGSKIRVITSQKNYYVIETQQTPLAALVIDHFSLKVLRRICCCSVRLYIILRINLCFAQSSSFEVNEKKPKGTTINFNKHGYDFGFKLARILAGWIPAPANLPKPGRIVSFVETCKP